MFLLTTLIILLYYRFSNSFELMQFINLNNFSSDSINEFSLNLNSIRIDDENSKEIEPIYRNYDQILPPLWDSAPNLNKDNFPTDSSGNLIVNP
jgi:hypothetical protein